ncbi:hypothetical protein [Acinetobacter sp. BSP-28]|uniref:hypothetical protein n=1 Tax=Acinetobacter sp. BSP-28 TaxID=3344661 RepID=UPI00376F72F3
MYYHEDDATAVEAVQCAKELELGNETEEDIDVTCLNNEGDNSVIADWITLTLVDEAAGVIFITEQVEENFTQSFADQVFSAVFGLKGLQ